jgi:hypothetical protein
MDDPFGWLFSFIPVRFQLVLLGIAALGIVVALIWIAFAGS